MYGNYTGRKYSGSYSCVLRREGIRISERPLCEISLFVLLGKYTCATLQVQHTVYFKVDTRIDINNENIRT